jgi:hypothetical protein
MPCRCLHHATEIARTPLADWKAAIESLPTKCPHTDCGEPKNCQLRNREYLRVQAKAMKHRRK